MANDRKQLELPQLDRKMVTGAVGWGVAISLLNKAGAVVVSLILVRLISAEAFGKYGLVSALLMFAFSFSMQRFMEHSYHGSGDDQRSYAEHLGFGIVLHVSIFAVLNLVLLLAPLPDNYAEVRAFAHVGTLSILLNIPRIFYSVHLRRMMEWRRQRTLHLWSFLLSATSSIGLAATGYGVWALLVQNLALPIPYIVDLARRHPELLAARFDLSGYVGVLTFGGLRSLSGIVGVGQPLAEASLLTAVAGFAGYGVYGRAAGIATLASAWLGDQIHGLMYPIIARVEPGSAQARRAAGLVLRLALWTSAPLAASLFVFNDTVVSVLYGPAWAEVSPLLRPALLIAVAGTTMRGLMLVLLTTEGPGSALVAEMGQVVVCLAGLTLVLSSGMLSYAWFLAGGSALLVTATAAYLVMRGALSLGDVVAAIAPILTLALLTGFVANAEQVQILDAGHSLPGLMLASVASGVIALTVARLVDPTGLASACHYLPGGANLAGLLRLGGG